MKQVNNLKSIQAQEKKIKNDKKSDISHSAINKIYFDKESLLNSGVRSAQGKKKNKVSRPDWILIQILLTLYTFQYK